MKLTLNPDSLTFGDMEDFQKATGAPLLTALKSIEADPESGIAGLDATALVALIWICGRTGNPDFTLDEARKIRMSEVEFDVLAVDPTNGGK